MTTVNDNALNHRVPRSDFVWDFIHDTNLHYFPARAIECVYQWRKKNTVSMLYLALQYISEAKEKRIITKSELSKCIKFTANLTHDTDKFVISRIYKNDYKYATSLIKKMINNYENG